VGRPSSEETFLGGPSDAEVDDAGGLSPDLSIPLAIASEATFLDAREADVVCRRLPVRRGRCEYRLFRSIESLVFAEAVEELGHGSDVKQFRIVTEDAFAPGVE
jgi:hypothetical protein